MKFGEETEERHMTREIENNTENPDMSSYSKSFLSERVIDITRLQSHHRSSLVGSLGVAYLNG